MLHSVEDLSADEFHHIIKEHELFQRTEGRQGKKAELHGSHFNQNINFAGEISYQMDYSGIDFSGIDCAHHVFHNCNLVNSKFSGANISATQFFGSNLKNADFRECFGVRVNMSYTRQDGTKHDEANYQEGKFDYAIGRNTSFYESNLIGASIGHASFIKADARYADFSFASLEGSDFSDSDFSFSKLVRADGTRSSFNNVNARQSNMSHMLLKEAKLLGLNVEEVYMASVMLVQAQHNLAVAQFGPLGRESGYATLNLKTDEVSLPDRKNVIHMKEFEKITKKDPNLKPALAAFLEAQNVFRLQNSKDAR